MWSHVLTGSDCYPRLKFGSQTLPVWARRERERGKEGLGLADGRNAAVDPRWGPLSLSRPAHTGRVWEPN